MAMDTPLKLYWNGGRLDNFTASTPRGEHEALASGYASVRVEGYVYPIQQLGTVPLKLFWNSTRGDNFTAATVESEQTALAAGYSFVRVEGYILPSKQPGTVPLKLYWQPGREDYFTTATAQGEQEALDAGYSFVRVEGYVAQNLIDVSEGLDVAVDRCGRMPLVVSGSTSMAPPTTSTVNVNGVAYLITDQRRKLVNDVVEHAFLQDIARMGIWPGQVIQGNALLEGDIAPSVH